MILSICESPDVLKVMKIINFILKIIRIVVPILLILSASLTMTKAVSDGELSKALKSIVIKTVAAVLVFFIPFFVKTIVNTVSNSNVYEVCMGEITNETIRQAYIKNAEMLVSRAEKTEDMADYNAAYGYLINLELEDREPFYKRLAVVKEKIDARRAAEEAERRKSRIMTGTLTGEKGTYTFYGDGTNHATASIQGADYIIVKSYLTDYVSYLRRAGVYQGSNEKYKSSCQGFALAHAWGLYKNIRSLNGEMANSYYGSGNYSGYVDSSLENIMQIIYNEILNGRPVVAQVNSNPEGTVRHFVTIVGFKSSVTSGYNLTEKDLLYIESWSATLRRMDSNGARFFTTGAKTGHGDSYKGYYIFTMKQSSADGGATSTNTSGGSGGSGGSSEKHELNKNCQRVAEDATWWSCFSGSHNLVVPSLGAQGSTITMKVGETRSFQVKLPSECGSFIQYTKKVADGSSGWRNYVSQSRSNVTGTGFTWTITANKYGNVTVSQTILYDAISPSGKCAKNVKSMYRFNINVRN